MNAEAAIDTGAAGTAAPAPASILPVIREDMTDAEIETLFSRYDVDDNRELDESEFQRMMADLEGKRRRLEEEMAAVPADEMGGADGLAIGAGAGPEKMIVGMKKVRFNVRRV